MGLLNTTNLKQGDLGLLDAEVAKRLLASTELARLAYVAADGLVEFRGTGKLEIAALDMAIDVGVVCGRQEAPARTARPSACPAVSPSR